MTMWGGVEPGKAEDGDLLETPTRQYAPRISGWYPSSFHCEQGQNLGLVDSVSLDLGVDFKWSISSHPPGPGENHLFNPIPLGSG